MATYVVTARIPAEGVDAFRRFEDEVLPLLADHEGRLARRLRSLDECTEVHLIEFRSREAFERYRADPRRRENLPLLERSGARMTVVEMHEVETAEPHYSRSRDGYVITTDPARLDLDVVHRFLRDAYWATGIPRDVLARAIRHSLPFGLYAPGGEQCGFARVLTDRAIAALLADVFVLPEHRGRGLGAWLVGCVLAHPDLQGLRRWSLATADAHGLYERFGFTTLANPEAHMAIERTPGDLWDRG